MTRFFGLFSLFTSRTVATLVAAFAIAAPVLAQTDRQETIQLSLDEAVKRAVEHNPDLAIVKLDTEVDAARVGQSQGAYAPLFSTTLGRSRNTTPPTSILTGDTGVDVKDWF